MKHMSNCGSGEPRRELKDARGIFCTFVCDKCEEEKRSHFRPDIFDGFQLLSRRAGGGGVMNSIEL